MVLCENDRPSFRRPVIGRAQAPTSQPLTRTTTATTTTTTATTTTTTTTATTSTTTDMNINQGILNWEYEDCLSFSSSCANIKCDGLIKGTVSQFFSF